ncbi:HEAT repeat domain-containing protein [Intestinibacter sp.]|uniref:HEAT repeat domain-containing protein n=1 Tax=Intestinibacter sp. TaxID=1965304 RepID=UPI002A9149C1|nr:HEAT repeat domain-containing protein [Intestinibacter sp.]MDY5213191.1 HEAT repeat domain-containing protein [Intestinibacter sp.]
MNNQFERKDALVEKLIACTNSENYKIRAAAYTALGNFVDIDEVLSKIKEGLEDTCKEVRDASLKSLKKIYNERKEKEFFQKWLYEIESLRKIS